MRPALTDTLTHESIYIQSSDQAANLKEMARCALFRLLSLFLPLVLRVFVSLQLKERRKKQRAVYSVAFIQFAQCGIVCLNKCDSVCLSNIVGHSGCR